MNALIFGTYTIKFLLVEFDFERYKILTKIINV